MYYFNYFIGIGKKINSFFIQYGLVQKNTKKILITF